jgi:hypothetical protein
MPDPSKIVSFLSLFLVFLLFYINYNLAKSKGQNVILVIILTPLFSIFLTLLLFLLPEKNPANSFLVSRNVKAEYSKKADAHFRQTASEVFRKIGNKVRRPIGGDKLPLKNVDFYAQNKCNRCRQEILGTAEYIVKVEEEGWTVHPLTQKPQPPPGSGLKTLNLSKLVHFENQRGFRCKACGSLYCMDCLFNHAPTHPNGGKACFDCGGALEALG